MRPTGLSWIALTGLMVLGATAAEAGVSCKIVPSWCPAGDGARDIRGSDGRNGVTASNKGHGEASTGASAGSNDVTASTAGIKTGTNGVGASTAGVAASTGAVAGKTTAVPEPASLFLLGGGCDCGRRRHATPAQTLRHGGRPRGGPD